MNWTKRINKLNAPISERIWVPLGVPKRCTLGVVSVLLIQLLLVACPGQTQCLAAYAVIPLEEAIPQATLIVIGTVESVTRRQEQVRFGATPEYAATVLVEETVRGQATAGAPITVRMVCEPHLQQGEYVLLLLAEQAPAVATLVAGPQGVYHLSVHDQVVHALKGISTDGDTSLAHLLDLIAALPPAPTAVATPLLGMVQPTDAPASTAVDSRDWPLYTSTQYGFSIKYPPGWQYQEVPNAACPMAGTGVWFFPAREQGCPGYTDARVDVEISITEVDPSPNWQPQFFDDYQVEQFKLGEVTGSKISGVNKESRAQELAVIANVGRSYILALPNHSPASLQYFEAMLSTFALAPATP